MPAYDWSGRNINTVHLKAADVDEIIEWTLTEFSKLNKVKNFKYFSTGRVILTIKLL